MFYLWHTNLANSNLPYDESSCRCLVFSYTLFLWKVIGLGIGIGIGIAYPRKMGVLEPPCAG